MTQTIGSRRQVWNGTSKKTSGGLTKSDLMMSHGRIVSKSKHFSAKKEMRLLKYGYGTQKGKFGFVKVGSKRASSRKGRKKMTGGSGYGQLSPANVDSNYMIQDVVPQSFNPLDRALVGGRNRSRHMARGRRMSGGAMSVLGPADIGATAVGGLATDGPVLGVTDYPNAGANDVQFAAGQAGGKRRHRRGKSMTGGTTSPSLVGAPFTPLKI